MVRPIPLPRPHNRGFCLQNWAMERLAEMLALPIGHRSLLRCMSQVVALNGKSLVGADFLLLGVLLP
jgi:hypothetical protein